MNAVIVLNKSKNKTSRDMVNELNHIFDEKKIGHTGTLDPIATGVLVMTLGRYTKLNHYLMSLTKEYIATVKIGIKTDTLDITGNILEERKCNITKEEIMDLFKSYDKKFIQTIPLYSAKKINGKKLYEYARNNIEIERPTNEVEIYNIELINFNNNEFTFKTKVSKGTYIRSLIEDMCNKLNIIGTMSELIRTKQGDFSLENSYTIDDIKKGNYKFLKIKDILNIPIYTLNEEEYFKAINGNPLKLNINDDNILLEYDNEEIAIYKKNKNEYNLDVMLFIK